MLSLLTASTMAQNSADAVKITASMDIPIIEDVLGLRFAGVT